MLDFVYETVRNLSSAKPEKAYANAMRLIDWQRSLGIWHEHAIQQAALDFTPLIVFANYFYGSVYIGATIFGLVFLYRRHSDDYPLWRNTLVIGTLLGLIGFATFPLMPPRLLDVMGDGHTYYGFVDTLLTRPTFWSFNSEGMKTHLQPVRGDAVAALRVGLLGPRRLLPAGEELVGQDPRRALPDHHHHRGGHHRQPLLPRRRRAG